ncbi:hypothetical protein CYY_003787 [Polysphondylium violaceum]|uniref:Rap-GAP domain-containing protein n=1 Tax=Polysphondylium violaceum TaxID=133409 RepID=A0A8J4UZW5_9MYCE|nr:hypothetical protein CYY_003787 [Polysphondylium violaceum]
MNSNGVNTSGGVTTTSSTNTTSPSLVSQVGPNIPISPNTALNNNVTPTSEKTKEKEKAKKKLAIFLDINLDSFKRFKGLSSFIANSDENEIDKVFKENSYQVYQTMLSTFSAYEIGTYKGKQHYAEKEVLKLMELLKRILIHLEGFVRKGWQVKSIINVLEKMLGIENIQSLRLSGFSVLMVFLEVMEKPDKYKLELFSSCIDFTPYIADYISKINLAKKVFASQELKRFIVIQSTEPPTKEDSTTLFEQIFVHMDKRLPNNFHFWFELLKVHYLSILYPNICKQNGILPPNDITGFVSHCPHELQVVIINYLSKWLTSSGPSNSSAIKDYFLYNIIPTNTAGSIPHSPSLQSVVDSAATTASSAQQQQQTQRISPSGSFEQFTNTPGRGNISILLEIFKQSCRLPLKYYEVIKKSISTFKHLFLENLNELDLGEDLNTYQTFIFNEMLHVFETESATYEKEREIIGTYIIDVYKYMIENYQSFKPNLKEIALNSMLQGTVALLRKSNPNKTVSLTLEQNIVSTTLYGWIKSKETNGKMWDSFHSSFEEIFYRPEVIKQIRSKLMQVTLVLKDLVYPLSQRKIQKKAKDIRNTSKGGEPKSLDHQDVPAEIPADPAIATAIKWDVESCNWIWHCILDLFKNLHRIKETNIHELATHILVDIVDLFIRTEVEVDFADSLDETRPAHLSLINIFGPRLFDTCLLDSKFIKSKVLALGCLCRLVCRHHPQYPISILSHFFGVINNAMISPPVNGVDLSWSIILNSSNIFNLSIPGANILIPTFLYKIKCILTLKNGELNPPSEVRKKCIIIVCSLIFYPNQFPNMDIYNQREVKGKLLGNDLTMAEMKKDIMEILHFTLKSDKQLENKLICTWGLSVFLMEEFNCNYNQDLINDIIDAITSNTLNIESSVARAALDSLSSIGLIFNKLNKPTINRILVSLCTSISKTLPEIFEGTSAVTEQTIAGHFHCLLDWISMDNSIFDDSIYSEFRTQMFYCIEEGLGLKGDYWSTTGVPVKQESVVTSTDSKDQLKSTTKNLTIKKNLYHKIKGSSSSSSNSTPAEEEPQDTTTKFLVIHDACETLLSHCFNFAHNFPSKEGAEFISSFIDEEDDQLFNEIEEGVNNSGSSNNNSNPNSNSIITNNQTHIHTLPDGKTLSSLPLFCVLNDNALISVVEIPKPNGTGTLARLFIRDATGKYVWNFDCDYDLEKQLNSNLQMYISNINDIIKDSNSSTIIFDQNQNAFKYINNVSQSPTIKPIEPDEKLNNLLLSLSKEHPECLPTSGVFLNNPLINLKSSLINEFTKNQGEINSFIERENTFNIDKYSLPPSGNSWSLNLPENFKPVVSQSSRLLMSYFGFLDFNISSNTLKQLESTNKLSRALTQLDITPGREILKIGVIYTAEGQDDQKDILRNDKGSDLYREFVDGLGWPVDLTTHQGYLGGLDRKKSTGITAPYYATPSIETIFHDITLMPTNPIDSQQIHKKRHVGNDIVNIVWSEHIRDYSPTTITSQFNDALVIVYPLSNGLFRIQIYRKESKVPMFGPLIHGMAVNKQLLSLLVRQTAINAYRYVRYNTPNYSKPFVLRKLRIKEIVDRYSSERNYVDYVHSIVSGSSNFQQAPPVTSLNTSNDNSAQTTTTTNTSTI